VGVRHRNRFITVCEAVPFRKRAENDSACVVQRVRIATESIDHTSVETEKYEKEKGEQASDL
jgi:hypothetical protein